MRIKPDEWREMSEEDRYTLMCAKGFLDSVAAVERQEARKK